MKKPMIGVMPLVDLQRESYWMLPGYFEGIMQAGGIPVMLPLTSDPTLLTQFVEEYDGFLFTGGQDASPELYGEQVDARCGECCSERDAMELKLIPMILAHDKPLLGICRGIQILNVALGGTLYQDLPSQRYSPVEHHQGLPYDQSVHDVSILRDSPLDELFGIKSLSVNSYHHQAVKTLADSLEAMAYSEDGLVEAVCIPDKRFIWAVQWHPEFSFRVSKESRKFFTAFINSCIG